MNIAVVRNGFAADETLTELQRIERYCFHSIAITRLAYVRRISDCAENVGKKLTQKKILPLLKMILKDQEKDVRSALAEQLGKLAQILADTKKKDGKNTQDVKRGNTKRRDSNAAVLLDLKKIQETGNGVIRFKLGVSLPAHRRGGLYLKVSQPMNVLHETSIVWNDASPSWSPFQIPLKKLDLSAPVKVVCWVKNNSEQKTSDFKGTVLFDVPKLLKTKPKTTISLSNRAGVALKDSMLHFHDISTSSKINFLSNLLEDEIASQSKDRKSITHKIIPCIQKLLIDEDQAVRDKACQALVQVAAVLDEVEVQTNVLTVVLLLAHDENEQHKIVASKLLSSLAKILGPLLCREFCAPELLHLADDPKCSVRKAAVVSFGEVAKVAGAEVTHKKLLPSFQHMAKDQVWSVRKSVVEQLVAMASASDGKETAKMYGEMFEDLANDASRWVRNSAFEVLGRLIHTLGEDSPRSLLTWFCKMPSLASTKIDQECTFFCAYNFPAVCQTSGFRNSPDLIRAFQQLSKDLRFPVRRALACSLHEMAHIVGPSMTERLLIGPFEKFLKDATNEVREGVLQGLTYFLAVLQPKIREKYLSQVWHTVRNSQRNWRFRQRIAEQLPGFTRVFSVVSVRDSVSALVSFLLRDDVAVVRRISTAAVPFLIQRLHEDNKEGGCLEILKDVTQLAESKTYKERQLFVFMAEAMIDSGVCPDIFKSTFRPLLVKLASDSISNIRITFVKHVLPRLSSRNFPEEILEKIRDHLSVDDSPEVAGLTKGEIAVRKIPASVNEELLKASKDMVNKVNARLAEHDIRRKQEALDEKAPPAPDKKPPPAPNSPGRGPAGNGAVDTKGEMAYPSGTELTLDAQLSRELELEEEKISKEKNILGLSASESDDT
ncbi:hypothetical protein AAMO2058_000261600 [Amorphochlora amoebiformis]